MNEYCHEAFPKGSGMTLSRADEFHARLQSCFEKLPQQLQPKFMVLPGHFNFQ